MKTLAFWGFWGIFAGSAAGVVALSLSQPAKPAPAAVVTSPTSNADALGVPSAITTITEQIKDDAPAGYTFVAQAPGAFAPTPQFGPPAPPCSTANLTANGVTLYNRAGCSWGTADGEQIRMTLNVNSNAGVGHLVLNGDPHFNRADYVGSSVGTSGSGTYTLFGFAGDPKRWPASITVN